MAAKQKVLDTEPGFFTKRNWTWLLIGVVVILAGFIALAMGSVTLAPILLVLGYCVLIPVGILIGPPKHSGGEGPNAGEHPGD